MDFVLRFRLYLFIGIDGGGGGGKTRQASPLCDQSLDSRAVWCCPRELLKLVHAVAGVVGYRHVENFCGR